MKFYALITSCNQIDTDLSNAQKCRYPDPEHNTKVNDFDVKWAILMLTEQFLKNRPLVPGIKKKLDLTFWNMIFYELMTSCNRISIDLSTAQNVDMQIPDITQKSMIFILREQFQC